MSGTRFRLKSCEWADEIIFSCVRWQWGSRGKGRFRRIENHCRVCVEESTASHHSFKMPEQLSKMRPHIYQQRNHLPKLPACNNTKSTNFLVKNLIKTEEEEMSHQPGNMRNPVPNLHPLPYKKQSLKTDSQNVDDIILRDYIKEQKLFNSRLKNEISALQKGLNEMKSLLQKIDINAEDQCKSTNDNLRNQSKSFDCDSIQNRREEGGKKPLRKCNSWNSPGSSTLRDTRNDESIRRYHRVHVVESKDRRHSISYPYSDMKLT